MLALAAVCATFVPSPAQDPVRDALSTDLNLIPGNAAGFIHVRVADLWNNELLTDVRRLLSKAGQQALQTFDHKFVPSVSTIDRVTLILPNAQTLQKPFPDVDPEAVSALCVVTTSKPFDAEQLYKAMAPEGRIKKHKGTPYYFLEETWQGLVIVDDHTFLLGAEDSLVEWLNHSAGKVSGPLDTLKQAVGKHPVVIGLNPGLLLPEAATASVPPPFQPLLQARGALLTLDVGKETRLEARLEYASEEQAKGGAKAVQTVLDFSRQQLVKPIQEMEQKVNQGAQTPTGLQNLPQETGYLFGLAALRQADELLGKLPVERNGSAVRISLSTPSTTPAGTPLLLGTVSLAAITALGQHANSTFQYVGTSLNSPGDTGAEDGLKKLAAAFERYYAEHHHYPPAALCDKAGHPLFSWRVALLPYLDEKALHDEFKLDEPWDSLHNKKLLKRMPKVFEAPYAWEPWKTWKTSCLVFTGPNALFDGKKGLRKQDVTDGLGNTLLVVRSPSDLAVPWTKPADLVVAPDKPLPELFGKFGSSVDALFADGSVRNIPKTTSPETLRALITRNGGEPVRPDSLP
jgi:hypothetical protein